MNTSIKTNNRLNSVDILRGFDMFMIVFADQFFRDFNTASKTKLSGFLATQFEHPEWLGSNFYDIIMPLFLFVVGVVIPFSMTKRIAEIDNKFSLYPHLIRRFVLLFILGWIVQGNLLALDSNQFHVFSNTLQAIAVGYLFSCIAFIHLNKKGRYILFILCLLIYTLLLELPSFVGFTDLQLLPDKNLPIQIDRYIMGRFVDGTQYSWLLTGFGFIATTLSGIFAGELLLSPLPRKKIASYLIYVGIAGIALGLILGMWHPIIKKLWTSTFVLASSGVCFLILAFFYWVIDVKGYSKWGYPFKIIGINAIGAYVGIHLLHFPEIAKMSLFGFEQFMGTYYNAFADIAGFGILYFILWYMNKNKTYIKI
ncbi:MAG: DUF5009 domain-containing protein [Flavobacteriaceae bacterium]|nr:DUF5009 domain-containing protein [Flavobacteriaceae bacterium]